ncbi:MAG: 50S ribosomal protein L11 methyltransferase [Balneolales bacterium]
MTNYIKLDISIPDDLQELLILHLENMDFTGFEQFDDRLVCYVPQARFSDVDREYIETWLMGQREECYIKEESILEETNWNETWENSIKPQTIGDFFVKPTWSDEAAPNKKILLEIDPKMAFGTGYHETTRLVLRLLPQCIRKNDKVLDVGTGTGILAIAALKLGATHALGVDIDEWSYNNALENGFINQVNNQLKIKEGSLELLSNEDRFDVVLANIDRNALLGLADKLIHHTNDTLVLSGLMLDDEKHILDHPAFSELELIERIQENDWIALLFKKR